MMTYFPNRNFECLIDIHKLKRKRVKNLYLYLMFWLLNLGEGDGHLHKLFSLFRNLCWFVLNQLLGKDQSLILIIL